MNSCFGPRAWGGAIKGPRIVRGALLLLFFILLASGASAQDAPGVTTVTITGSDPSRIYETGENIHIIVVFSPEVVVTGTPTIGLDIGDETKTADFAVATRRTLTFRYTVEDGDSDYDGISVPANSLRLNGATILSPGGMSADLTHDKLQTSHRVNPDPPTEREVLGILYEFTGGGGWSNSGGGWAADIPDSVDLDGLDGVTAPDGEVTGLDLYRNQLSGEIPAALGSLSNLEILEFDRNLLEGEIPAILGILSNLEILNLYDNRLSGRIPAELGGLSSLEQLRLQDNELSGTIPRKLGSLSNLAWLQLSGNQLSGRIPPQLGNLRRLEFLFLNDNELSGLIPSGLGSLSGLEELRLDGNQLEGRIPAELGELGNLGWLHLNDNQLSGEIPAELGELGMLLPIPSACDSLVHPVCDVYLHLNDNELSGEIPAELGNIEQLRWLYLYNNQLSGEIPAELGNIENLQRLYLYNNRLSGEIPAELGNIENLQRLYLYNNRLSGEIPAELGNIENLQRLYLYNNRLSGEIPPELGSLSNLRLLYLNDNRLSGEIPAKLGDLTGLLVLSLGNNRLGGTIPAELGDLTNLWWLYLNNNQLSGPIPPELGSLSNLRLLYLNDNNLTGPIPQKFEDFLIQSTPRLQELALWGNEGLTGVNDVSPELGKRIDRAVLRALYDENGGPEWTSTADGNEPWLPEELFLFNDWYGVTADETTGRVKMINLSGNGLKGKITSKALETLKGLETLDLSHNPLLTGTLPEGLMNLTSLRTLNIRCTGISTSRARAFKDWLGTIAFITTGAECQQPPLLPGVTHSHPEFTHTHAHFNDGTGYYTESYPDHFHPSHVHGDEAHPRRLDGHRHHVQEDPDLSQFGPDFRKHDGVEHTHFCRDTNARCNWDKTFDMYGDELGLPRRLTHSHADSEPGHGYDWTAYFEEEESGTLRTWFVSPPERHDGEGQVEVRVGFSEAIEESPEVGVEGGEVTSAREVYPREEDQEVVVWEFEIEPDSDEDLTVSIEAGRSCEEPGAVCTTDGRALSEGISTMVRGPDYDMEEDETINTGETPAPTEEDETMNITETESDFGESPGNEEAPEIPTAGSGGCAIASAGHGSGNAARNAVFSLFLTAAVLVALSGGKYYLR